MVSLTIYNNDFNLAYGRAMHAWAIIDQSLANWFRFLLNHEKPISDIIFYSNRGFMERINMIVDMLQPLDINPDIIDNFKKLRSKMNNYNDLRNRIAHGSPSMIINEDFGADIPLKYVLCDATKKYNSSPTIEIEHLNLAADNFLEASRLFLLLLTYTFNKEDISKSDLPERIKKLPSKAETKSH